MKQCPEYQSCKKLKEIKNFDPGVYDVEGLIEDICWACSKQDKKAE